jgi:quinolinate synthase
VKRGVTDRTAGLNRRRNAVAPAHNCQPPAGQDIADFVGDSLGLSVAAAGAPADVIVFCGVHSMAETAALRKEHPAAEVIVHPQCRPEVTVLADVVTSTEGTPHHARESRSACVGVGTEVGLLHRLSKESPDSRFIPLTSVAGCPNMKRATLAGLMPCLERMQHRASVPEEVRRPAAEAVERMPAVGAGAASAAGLQEAEA